MNHISKTVFQKFQHQVSLVNFLSIFENSSRNYEQTVKLWENFMDNSIDSGNFWNFIKINQARANFHVWKYCN